MLQQAGTGQDPVLGHMAHQHQRDAQTAAGFQQGHAHGTHLIDVAGQAFGIDAAHGLHRVHHQQAGRRQFQSGDDLVHTGSGHGQQIVMQHAEPLAPGLDLRQGFFAAGVQHPAPLGGDQTRHLQQKGGLADARLTADKDGRSRYQAFAQHPVQRGDAAGIGMMPGLGHILQRHGAVARGDGSPGSAAGQGLGLGRGLQGVPLMAAGALATPLQGLCATG